MYASLNWAQISQLRRSHPHLESFIPSAPVTLHLRGFIDADSPLEERDFLPNLFLLLDTGRQQSVARLRVPHLAAYQNRDLLGI